MPIKITTWKCEYCRKVFNVRGRAVDHEFGCRFNPKNKTCSTCRFYEIPFGTAYCTKMYNTFAVTDCPDWDKRV